MWSLDKGFSSNEPYVYPNRVKGVGDDNKLEVFLVTTKYSNSNYVDFEGYQVHLHAPNDFPWPSKKFIRVSKDKDVALEIKPLLTTSSPRLRNYTPEQRNCYFEDERYLKYFKAYTQSNCKLECLTNFTLQSCGCVKFSMPRDKSAKTKVCDLSKIDCWSKAEKLFFQKELAGESHETSGENKGKTSCNCMLSCTTIRYEAITSQETAKNEYLSVSFYFSETEFNMLYRVERFGFTDFISGCGGILGRVEAF